jgi:hypothetical protein
MMRGPKASPVLSNQKVWLRQLPDDQGTVGAVRHGEFRPWLRLLSDDGRIADTIPGPSWR